jgi:hypothetical protein
VFGAILVAQTRVIKVVRIEFLIFQCAQRVVMEVVVVIIKVKDMKSEKNLWMTVIIALV